MKVRYLLLISFVGVVLAFASFRIGLSVFMKRAQAIHDHKEAIGAETVYLGDVVHANRAAETGAWIAGILLLTSILIFARAVRKLIGRKREVTPDS